MMGVIMLSVTYEDCCYDKCRGAIFLVGTHIIKYELNVADIDLTGPEAEIFFLSKL
jgi:hypothetical protein